MRSNRCNRLALAALELCLAAGIAAAAASEPAPDLAPIIRNFRERIPAYMAEDRIPGLAVALVADGRVAWVEGFGATEDGGGAPVTPDTFFSLQSNSKAFTALAVLAAVQDGLLDLDAPIATYLPGFTIPSRFGGRPEEQITLRCLLSHTAGLAHEAPVGNNYDPGNATFEEHIQSIRQTWLRYPAGERYAYSNLGVDLAGYILQQVSGKPFAECARETFLAPIGMPRSSFDIRDVRRYPSRAVGHDNYLARVPLEIPMIPAGAFYSSAREMGAFLLFHVRKGCVSGTAVLPEPLLEQMYTIPFPVPGQKNGYALGVYRERRHGTASLSHSGGGFGFLSHMRWYPEPGLGIAVLTNATGHNRHTRLADEILEAIIARRGIARKEPHAAPPPERTPGADVLSRLTGSYVSERGVEWDLLSRDGAFGIQSGSAFFPLHFTSDREAFERDGEEIYQYRFQPEANGRPASILLVDEGIYFDRNDGPGDAPGPDRPEWAALTGQYRMLSSGTPVEMLDIRVRNGHLYLNDLRLQEQAPGRFFACTGDVLEWSGPVLRWRNVPMERIPIRPVDWLILGASALILAAAGIGALAAPLTRRLRRGKIPGRPEPARRSHRLADALAWTAGVAALVFLGVILFRFPLVIGHGTTWNPRFAAWMKVSYFLPAAVALLSLATAVAAALAWKPPAWPARRRIAFTAVALALLACTAMLLHWNLISL